MLIEMIRPFTYSREFLTQDDSWKVKVQNFVNVLNLGISKSHNVISFLEVLGPVEKIHDRTER